MKRIIKFVVTVSAAICIALPLASCGGASSLDSPTGFVLDENYNLTWAPVEHARSYYIDVKNVETGASEEATSRKEVISLSYLKTGDYDIRIRAVGDGSHYSDSEWSAVISFNRAYESGCTYQLINNDLEYEVVSAVATATEIVLEDSYRGKPVTSLGVNSFRNAQKLETVVVGSNVKSIGSSSFYNCIALKNVTLPDTVSYIGEGAFQNCKELKSFTVPSGVTALQKATFSYCRALKEIDLNNVTVIGESVFNSCTGLEEFTIPDTVTSIGINSFSNATALEEITVGSGLNYIGTGAFSGCTALKNVNFSDAGNLKSIGSSVFSETALTEVELPEGLEKIGNYVFNGTESLHSVSIPDSVTVVGYNVFHNTAIYKKAVENNDRLVYADKWLVQMIRNEADPIKFLDTENPDGSAETEVIKEGTVGIADGTFFTSSVVDVKLPRAVKYLGVSAFSYCEDLMRFDSSESALEVVDMGAFAHSTRLQYVYFNLIDEHLKEIGSSAFEGCEALNYESKSARGFIPSTVEHIGANAFLDTKLYKNADEYGVVYADDWVVGCTGSYTIIEDDLVVQPSDKTHSSITLRDDAKIADYAFYACLDLNTVSNSTGIKIIGTGSFYHCVNLTSFSLGSNVRRIGDYAFYNCQNLMMSDFRNIRSIGRAAFYNCLQMHTVRMSFRLEDVGMFAFYNCKNLTNLTIGEGLTEIAPYSFYGCENLKSVTIPSNIQSIGMSAFSHCSALEEIIFEEGVETIGNYAFRSATALKEINLPDSVKTVEYGAFLQCESVENIDLGMVENIGDYAFAENLGVRSLVIPESVKTIGRGAFAYLGAEVKDENGVLVGVKSIVLNANIETIGAHSFYGCHRATFFLEGDNENAELGTGWNSSRRPTVWGATLSEDNSYVVSLTVGEDTFQYFSVFNWIGEPFREGYKFVGWSTSEDSYEIAYSMQNVVNAPVGTTLYAVYI